MSTHSNIGLNIHCVGRISKQHFSLIISLSLLLSASSSSPPRRAPPHILQHTQRCPDPSLIPSHLESNQPPTQSAVAQPLLRPRPKTKSPICSCKQGFPYTYTPIALATLSALARASPYHRNLPGWEPPTRELHIHPTLAFPSLLPSPFPPALFCNHRLDLLSFNLSTLQDNTATTVILDDRGLHKLQV